MGTSDRGGSFLRESLYAHALRFERPLSPTHGSDAGVRVLIAFMVVAVGVFYGFRFVLVAATASGAPVASLGFVMAFTLVFLAAQRWYVRVPMADIGLRPFAAWTRRERLYSLQVVPMASVAFALVFREHLAALLELHGAIGFALFSIATGLVWGLVQEFLYRGWLQTELTRRFGPIVGLLAANLAFTFGPLHLSYLMDPDGVRWAGLATVFGIGLLFGFIYRRSGNLWLPAVMHGIWPLNMT